MPGQAPAFQDLAVCFWLGLFPEDSSRHHSVDWHQVRYNSEGHCHIQAYLKVKLEALSPLEITEFTILTGMRVNKKWLDCLFFSLIFHWICTVQFWTMCWFLASRPRCWTSVCQPDVSQVLCQRHCLENQLSMNAYMVCWSKWVGWLNGMQTPQLASVAEVSWKRRISSLSVPMTSGGEGFPRCTVLSATGSWRQWHALLWGH